MSFLSRLFNPIMSTAKYESQLAAMDNNCKKLKDTLNSEAYKRFLELKDYVESGKCKADIAAVKNLKYKGSAEFATEDKLKQLMKIKVVKEYLQNGANKDSVQVAEYLRLKTQIETPEFKERKAYLSDTEKHKKCEAYKQLEEFNSIKNSADIKQLPKLQKQCTEYLAQAEQWESTFSDNFDSAAIDSNWISKPLAGEKHLGKSYSQQDELQLTTDGKNLSVANSVLRIATKQEQAEGLRWDKTHGFVPSKFNYTSGIASTATKFEQSQGKIEAKLRLPKTSGTYSSFWLGSEKMLPIINVFSFGNGKFQVGAAKDGQSISKKLPSLNDEFYIVCVEWNNAGISWKINGKEVFASNIRVDEKLYLAFSSGVVKDTNALPMSLDVDWVRCYKRK